MINKNYDLILSEYGVDKDSYFVAEINGADCKSKTGFLKAVGSAFLFPDYYGMNLDAFAECINDLDWLDKPNYALVIYNSNLLLNEESEEVKLSVLELLKNAQQQWANVPNYKGEDDYRKKGRFEIIYK
jgi:RNAse (barnase) inhibitor barstar